MTKIIIIVISVLFILFLSSCRTVSEDNGSISPSIDTAAVSDSNATSFDSEKSVSPSIEASPSQDVPQNSDLLEPAAPLYPLYFPMPYYNAFVGGSVDKSSGNIDAFLHNIAVNNYSSRVDAGSGHLLLVSLRLLDEWDAGNGATYYLCFKAEYDYYDLAKKLLEKGNHFSNYYTNGNYLGDLIRFKVTSFDYSETNVTNWWGFSAIEILEQPMWGTGGGTIAELCGDRPIADALLRVENGIDRNTDVPFIRDILPSEYAHDMRALLKKYLEAFFPEFVQFCDK